MQDLTIDDFTGWLNGACEVAAPDGRVPMTLVVAEPLTGSPRAGGGFRLEFLGPREPLLGQSIMSVERPERTDDIFLVPVSQDGEGTRYEAVFF